MRTALLTVVLVSLATAPALVGQPPGFDGTWVATTDAPPALGLAPSAVFGERFGLRQDGNQLVLLRPVRGRTNALITILPLDGTKTRVMAPARPCLGQSGQLISTTWVGDELRYSITGGIQPGGGAPTKIHVPYSIRKLTPDSLVVEATMRDPGGPTPRAVGTVYRRSTDTLTADPAPTAPATIAQIGWLSGDWVGGTGTTSLEERWSPASGGAMIATSRTMRSTVMTEFEFLCISERDGTLVYTAMPNAATRRTSR